jgi:hypothetical protein
MLAAMRFAQQLGGLFGTTRQPRSRRSDEVQTA